MPALMPRDVLFDTALLRYCFDAVLAVGVTGNWQQFVPFGHAVVFLDDVSGNVQQPDIRFDACFLAVRVDPQMPVERGAQVGFRQVRHIRPAQTRKGAEDEQIADQLVAFLFECAVIRSVISSWVRKPRLVSSFVMLYAKNGSRCNKPLLTAI